MKKKILLLALKISFNTIFGQSFEGKITYSNSYQSKSPLINNKQLSHMFGTTNDFYIKNGNYKSISSGAVNQWRLYLNSSNKLYKKMSFNDTIYWNDCEIKNNTIKNIEVNKNITTVLGYKCHEVILKSENCIQKYYFNSKFTINSNLFLKHTFDNWYYYLAKCDALPLKSYIETSEFILESVATDIDQFKINDEVFNLPLDLPLRKSEN